jgi:hypothetical protein
VESPDNVLVIHLWVDVVELVKPNICVERIPNPVLIVDANVDAYPSKAKFWLVLSFAISLDVVKMDDNVEKAASVYAKELRSVTPAAVLIYVERVLMVPCSSK